MARTAVFRRLRALLTQAMPQPLPRPVGGVDRRTFLQGSAAALTVAAASGSSGCAKEQTPRVAVIGGGIAGLHCAVRLSQAGVDVSVFESSDRMGGRMWTAVDKFLDGQVCELGGELIDSNHATMWALAEELGLTFDDRWADEPTPFARDTWWVDGAAVSDETILTQFEAVAPQMVADVTAADETDDAYARLDAQSLLSWLNTHVPAETYPELHAVLATAYRGEFGLELDRQSALNMLYLIGADTTDEFLVFGDSDERWHTHNGNEAFIGALAARLDPTQLVTGSTLIRVAGDGDGYVLSFDSAAGTSVITVDHVVFALPFTRLREVDLDNAGLPDDKRELIDTLGMGTNAKVMIGFTRPVWREDHAASGSLTGTLDAQQAWDTSIGQAGDSAILTNFLGGDTGLASDDGTPEAWAATVVDELDTVWPGLKDAATGTAVRMHWPTYPHTKGSYTCYEPGQWAWWGTEGQRVGNLHFCGEHTSADFQGWMEGGAETGALVAAEVLDDLGLAYPETLARIAARKLVVPQPCYHGGRVTRSVSEVIRRRLVLARAARG